MEIDPAIFRAYDIRGKVGETLKPDVAVLIGKAFGTYIKVSGGKKVSVSWDNRSSSKDLAKDFIHGVISTGINVYDLGLTTTPVLYFSIIHWGLDGGAIITGSHNTPDYNGIKLCQASALHVFGDELQKILWLARTKDFETGQGKLSEQDISETYEREILSRIKLAQSVKLAVDCGDGVSGLFAPRIFEKLGCQVIPHACRPLSDFTHGGADPSEPQNLSDLAKVVTENKADLGIGFDPDADRLGVVNEKGGYVPIEKPAALLAKNMMMKGKRKFIYDVKSLLGFKTVVESFGGQTEMLPTGRSYFRQKLFEDHDVALGVEASGHIHINDNFFGFDDAIFAAARLLEVLSTAKSSLSALLSEFPKSFYTPEIKPACSNERKFLVVQKVKEELAKKYDAIEADGVKFFLDSTSWGLVRASNTGPHLSLRFEGDTSEKVVDMINIVAHELKKFPEVDQRWLDDAARVATA